MIGVIVLSLGISTIVTLQLRKPLSMNFSIRTMLTLSALLDGCFRIIVEILAFGECFRDTVLVLGMVQQIFNVRLSCSLFLCDTNGEVPVSAPICQLDVMDIIGTTMIMLRIILIAGMSLLATIKFYSKMLATQSMGNQFAVFRENLSNHRVP